MNNWIDSIFSETRDTRAVVVVSEQHDVQQIDTGGGAAASLEQRIVSIRSGGWDAAEYGISAEEQIKRLRLTMGDPVAMAKEDEILRLRAINRAQLDTSNGRIAVMVAGKAPWHRLGVHLANAVDSVDAINHAGLNWTVSMRPLSYQHNGTIVEQTEARAIVRDDTGACLGVVGSRYTPIQNAEGFGFLDAVLSEHGAKYTSAGALHQGRKVWMLADLPNCKFSVGSGDEVKTYCIFSNPHDGSGKAYCYPTTERVVCANTLRVSTRDQAKGIGIRHTGSVKTKIADAQTALAQSVDGFRTFRGNAEAMVRARIRTPNAYFNTVLDAVSPVSAADVQRGATALARSRCRQDVSPDDFTYALKTAEKEIRSRGEILDDILERFESERCRTNGIAGTVWSALQACTEHFDYHTDKRKVGTTEAQMSRRFESVLAGDRDEGKQVAYTQAMQLTR